MGANRYWCENSFGAIKKFLWIEIGHFVAIFLHFWAFLVTLMAVATTILLTLGTGCTKRLLRHMGWWYGTIFALLSHIASAGWGQKWLIFEVKIRSQWQASSRAGNQPGNLFYVPCHLPIHGTAWLWTIFDHPSHISMAGGGQKWLIFRSKSGRNGRLVPGQATNLETVLCAISPPNTWVSMTMDHFWPPQPYIHGWRG